MDWLRPAARRAAAANMAKNIPVLTFYYFASIDFLIQLSAYVWRIPHHHQFIHSLIFLPLSLHLSLLSLPPSPSLQCWMSAILSPALLFRDEGNGGPSIKGHRATLPLAVHQSLYSDWLAGRGLVALLFPLTFPADPMVLANHTRVKLYTTHVITIWRKPAIYHQTNGLTAVIWLKIVYGRVIFNISKINN